MFRPADTFAAAFALNPERPCRPRPIEPSKLFGRSRRLVMTLRLGFGDLFPIPRNQ